MLIVPPPLVASLTLVFFLVMLDMSIVSTVSLDFACIGATDQVKRLFLALRVTFTHSMMLVGMRVHIFYQGMSASMVNSRSEH